MELSRFLAVLLLLVAISCYIDARKTNSSGRRNSSPSRTTQRGSQKPTRQQQVSQAKKGEDYRNWAAKLTGAGNEQRPKVGGNTGQHGKKKETGSNSGQIGWNVNNNNQKPQSGTHDVKPSAPDLATKTSASNTQSAWNPSGGYSNRQPAQNPSYGTQNQYNPSAGGHGGYNPPVNSGGYNPSAGNHYGPPPAYGQSHGSPAYGGHGAPPPYSAHGQSYHSQSHAPPPYSQPYNPYNPSYGHSSYNSNPGVGYNPPVGHVPQTILVQGGGSSRPGIGQLAKEAFVYAGVSAGVNAAVNRILPGGIYGHSSSSSSGGAVPAVAGPVSHTQITYNNYYNNNTDGTAAAPNAAAPAAPAASAAPVQNPGETMASSPSSNASPPAASAAAPAPTPDNSKPVDPQEAFARDNPSPLGFVITNADLKKLSEDLSSKEKNNAFKHITMNVQGQKMDDSVTDDAPEPLLTVKEEAYEIPTVKAVEGMHKNYELDVKTKEVVTPEERKAEDELLDKFLETEVLSTAMKFLADKGYIPNDQYEYKDALKRVWFSQFKRIDGDASSSGFETVFLAEQIDKEIIGLHNWIYFAKREEDKKANYLGYIKQTSLGNIGAIVKLRASLNDIVLPVGTIFVGTSPELEMALYTVCFYTRPNNPCPVTIGGTDFVIISNRVNYFGKDILVSAYPEI